MFEEMLQVEVQPIYTPSTVTPKGKTPKKSHDIPQPQRPTTPHNCVSRVDDPHTQLTNDRLGRVPFAASTK